jgi:hypothetical protein
VRHVETRVSDPRAVALRAGRRARPLVLAAVFMVFVIVLSDAPAHARPSRTAACSTITVNVRSTRSTVRVVRIGPVSCAKARRLARAWLRRLTAGRCGKLNNFCVLRFRGGWSCSIFAAAVQQTAGGAGAGCFRPHPRTKIRLYFKDHPAAAHARPVWFRRQ